MSAAEQRLTVDVIVSSYNEEAYIERCLDRALGQDYEPDLLRIWLVDGGSIDRTVELARARAQADPRLTVVADGRRRNLPEALNVGLELSSGELVAKVDAHGYPELDFVRRAVDALADHPDAGCAGGRPEQEGETPFGEAVALARTSRFGVGGSGYAGTSERGPVDTVQCGVYRRTALDAVGLFDPTMNFGEDEELNWRLRQAGFPIVLDTAIRFHYVTRPSWRALYRQYRNYGEARVRVVRRHPAFLRPWHVAPAAFVAGSAVLGAAAPLSRLARRGLFTTALAYGAGATAAALQAAGGRGPKVTARVLSCFVAIHGGYGVGSLRGLRILVSR